jgi:hypothetical protein
MARDEPQPSWFDVNVTEVRRESGDGFPRPWGPPGFRDISGARNIVCADSALHELPRSAESHSEASNHYEAQIGHKVSVMRTQNERDGKTEFGSIGHQAHDENENVPPSTRMGQPQPQGAEEAKSCHNRRPDSKVVVARGHRLQPSLWVHAPRTALEIQRRKSWFRATTPVFSIQRHKPLGR